MVVINRRAVEADPFRRQAAQIVRKIDMCLFLQELLEIRVSPVMVKNACCLISQVSPVVEYVAGRIGVLEKLVVSGKPAGAAQEPYGRSMAVRIGRIKPSENIIDLRKKSSDIEIRCIKIIPSKRADLKKQDIERWFLRRRKENRRPLALEIEHGIKGGWRCTGK